MHLCFVNALFPTFPGKPVQVPSEPLRGVSDATPLPPAEPTETFVFERGTVTLSPDLIAPPQKKVLFGTVAMRPGIAEQVDYPRAQRMLATSTYIGCDVGRPEGGVAVTEGEALVEWAKKYDHIPVSRSAVRREEPPPPVVMREIPKPSVNWLEGTK